ncbi:MAG: DUF1003 domain-containing protein [Pyrinomonadaceae bacterium]
MADDRENTALRHLKKGWEKLNERERRVIERVIERVPISRNTYKQLEGERTFGERVADRIAEFGGSWTFIGLFLAVLAAWVVLNSFLLSRRDAAFDPYPYILLNLFLSMVASLQAPVIMMSQNRHSAKDRIDAAHDYEVNLKAELEIVSLHEKIDDLRDAKWMELVATQQQQIALLERLLNDRK